MFAAAFAAAADPVRHIGTVRHTGAPTPWYSACLYSCYPSGCELGWIKIGNLAIAGLSDRGFEISSLSFLELEVRSVVVSVLIIVFFSWL